MGIERTRAVLLLTALAVAGCGRKEQPGTPATTAGTGTMTETPRVELGTSAQLDSGNTAFRAKDYQGALAHYRKATEREPALAAGWFGLYMAQSALGDKAGADSSMRKVQALAPGTMGAHPAPGSGTMPGSGGAALPPGHPGSAPAQLPPGHPATTTTR